MEPPAHKHGSQRTQTGRASRPSPGCDTAIIRVLPVEMWTTESFECPVTVAEPARRSMTPRVLTGALDVCL